MTTNSKNLLVIDTAAEGGYRAANFEEILEAARAALSNRVKKGTALTSRKLTRDYLMTRLSARDHEVFTVIFMDNRHRVIECLEMFRGTIDGASVHPREVVKEALQRNAAAVILSHNHPSGVAEPSQADELITSRLRDALALIDVRVLDHIIIAGGQTLSLAERGLI
jgi:DNA repair protein RadC